MFLISSTSVAEEWFIPKHMNMPFNPPLSWDVRPQGRTMAIGCVSQQSLIQNGSNNKYKWFIKVQYMQVVGK